jgi:hypothetical protein
LFVALFFSHDSRRIEQKDGSVIASVVGLRYRDSPALTRTTVHSVLNEDDGYQSILIYNIPRYLRHMVRYIALYPVIRRWKSLANQRMVAW